MENDKVFHCGKHKATSFGNYCTMCFSEATVETVLSAPMKIMKQPEGGTKHDTNKIPVDLVSTLAVEEIAKVLGFGAQKYAAHNWRKGIAWSRVIAALLRHIYAFSRGEDKDPESGLSHLAHAGCCIMFLLEFEKTHKELDDRYKYVPKEVPNKD